MSCPLKTSNQIDVFPDVHPEKDEAEEKPNLNASLDECPWRISEKLSTMDVILNYGRKKYSDGPENELYNIDRVEESGKCFQRFTKNKIRVKKSQKDGPGCSHADERNAQGLEHIER
ncbi:hypothetical protein DPEC_G00090040 [Dallia pectoralis]|uniref:Uncharacterized protein n=1 Tax=Dallia pectoralis TaxID=75939 RepID=A0ACC2H0S4_DALPE|nr:hypothetical protein DPEC_G00090040 [Dallia pectoralis]